mmetsp:Transcript_81366/g.174164  ORF Transcript_81366/g.174164 Transcript_81366/m.174164 type:complete len:410 (+) Transcript_81366:597-1826(+)
MMNFHLVHVHVGGLLTLGCALDHTLRVLVLQAEVHSLVDSGEHPLLADEALQLRLPHRPLHAIAHHGERHLDIPAAQVVHDILDNVDCRGIDGDDWCHLQDYVLGLVHILKVRYVGEKHVLDVGCVREVHRGANAANEHIRDEGAAAFLLHISVDRRARYAPEDRNLWADGLVDHDHQGHTHRHSNAHEHAEEERADKGDDPKEKVVPLDLPERHGLPKGHERDDGVHHDRRQSKLGCVIEKGRQEEQRAEHHRRCYDARALRKRPRAVVHRRPRKASSHGVAREGGTHQVRDAQSKHLLASLYFVAMLCGKVLADGDRFHIPDDACRERCGQDLGHRGKIPRIDGHWHEARRNIADGLHVIFVVENGHQPQHESAHKAADEGSQRAHNGYPLEFRCKLLVDDEETEER